MGGLTCNWDVAFSALKTKSQTKLFYANAQRMKENNLPLIEHFKNDSPYATANGNTAVILTSNDAALAVEELYAANAQHTLRFMASNIVGTAQKVVWERIAKPESCARYQGDTPIDAPKQSATLQDEIQSANS